MFFKGAGIDAYADRHFPFLCGVHHLSYPVDGADVSGIDSDLVSPVFYGFQRHTVVEMDICHQRYVITHSHQFGLDASENIGSLLVGNREPHDVTARIREFYHLIYQRLFIVGIHVGHGLNGDGISSAYIYFAYSYDLTHFNLPVSLYH